MFPKVISSTLYLRGAHPHGRTAQRLPIPSKRRRARRSAEHCIFPATSARQGDSHAILLRSMIASSRKTERESSRRGVPHRRTTIIPTGEPVRCWDARPANTALSPGNGSRSRERRLPVPQAKRSVPPNPPSQQHCREGGLPKGPQANERPPSTAIIWPVR